MGATTEANLKGGAIAYLAPGESILAYLIASDERCPERTRRVADAAGIRLAAPMALVLTPLRLVTLKLADHGRPTEFLNEFPRHEVGRMEVRRTGLGAAVTVTLCGIPIRLESRAGPARAFAANLA